MLNKHVKLSCFSIVARRSVGLILGLILVIACSGPATNMSVDENASQASKLRVVTSVSPITSIVENIGGTRIALQGIVPEGVNSHTFDPAPSLAKDLAAADLIVLNGLFLEESIMSLAESNVKSGSSILLLGDRAVSPEQWQFDFSFPKSHGKPNPHLWPDPFLALVYARLVRDQLGVLDPGNAEYYNDNFASFESRINELDLAVRSAIESIPYSNRKLLTYHDSWAYFALRYDMQIIGAVQPSDYSEPSPREVAKLIDQIKHEGIPAVFGSEVFSSDILEQIAAESGAKFIDELADDDLPGKPGDPNHSYIGLMAENGRLMTEALGGDPRFLSIVDPSVVFDGEIRGVYPQ